RPGSCLAEVGLNVCEGHFKQATWRVLDQQERLGKGLDGAHVLLHFARAEPPPRQVLTESGQDLGLTRQHPLAALLSAGVCTRGFQGGDDPSALLSIAVRLVQRGTDARAKE